jgi:hypothetical protein
MKPKSSSETLLQITKSKLLLVEGQDDLYLLGALLRHLNLADDIQIIMVGGKDQFAPYFKGLKINPGYSRVTSIGIVRDADADPAGAFQSVCSALSNAGLPVPTAPLQSAGAAPKITVLIVPGESRTGMLEDICLESVADDPAMGCVEEYFGCLEGKFGADDERLKNRAKSKVQVFLASQASPGWGLGVAAQKGYWGFNHPSFEGIKQFLGIL